MGSISIDRCRQPTAAISRFGMKGFIEPAVLAGFYEIFSAINQAFAIAPPSGKPAPSETATQLAISKFPHKYR